MLKIRLTRIGAKKKPFYRVVVIDERAKRNGAYIELLGTYNPLTEPKDIKLKQERIDYWVKQGAQLSIGFLRVIGKAPQRPPRKPKKEKRVEAPKVAEETKTEEAVKEETAEKPNTEETPAEVAPTEEQTAQENVIPGSTSTSLSVNSATPESNEPEATDEPAPSTGPATTEESGKKDEGSA